MSERCSGPPAGRWMLAIRLLNTPAAFSSVEALRQRDALLERTVRQNELTKQSVDLAVSNARSLSLLALDSTYAFEATNRKVQPSRTAEALQTVSLQRAGMHVRRIEHLF